MTNHIIINSTIPRIRYTSNGTLATYSFPFAIFKNSDLKVYFGSTLQESSTYSISGAGQSSGGTVTLSQVPVSGTIITLTRELPIERTSDFQEGGTLRADTLNHELDYQIACQQQIADNLNRSMVLPPYAADANVNLTLPTPNAGKAIVWNAAGTNLENSTVSVNAMESTLNGYKTAAETAAATASAQATEATTQAQNAATQAQTAATQATTATTQAGIATQKAQEVSSALSTKANINMDNLSETGQKKVVSLGRQFTNIEQLVCSGGTGTAGTYNLSQYLSDTTSVKLGIFRIFLQTSNSGFSSVAIGSDVCNSSNVVGTNNSFGAIDYIMIPFKRDISVSFPSTSAGIGSSTSCLFLGYM